MDFNEYRKRGKELIDFIADYLENIRSRRVFPDVKPGYMRHLVPDKAPDDGEHWEDIFKDVERVIMPGVTHWQSPYMHAYFPALNSFPSLLGDMLADALGCLGFTWASSPACTELETIVMDWLGNMIGLPSDFLHSNIQTLGGGVIQTTACEATFVSLLAARSEAIKRVRLVQPQLDDAEINARLVGYCSEQAHSSVEKAGLIGLVKMHLLPADEQFSLRGHTLQEAVEKDRLSGLIPFYLCATLGTTGACAFDNLVELGPYCESQGIWMHIDAAYAGTAFVCPEYRHFLTGVEYAQSFAFNPSKWMMVHFDCTAMWVKNSGALHRTFNVQPLYLRHENTGAAIDYMHWQIPLSRRFRALKLWFVIRSFGVKGLQKHVREGVRLAKRFEHMVLADTRFDIPAQRHLGMVVFRLKGDNSLTEALLKRLNSTGKLHMVPASLTGLYVIRFTVTSQYTTDGDIARDWTIIQDVAGHVLAEAEVAGLPTNGLLPAAGELHEDETKPVVVETGEEEQEHLSQVGQRHKDAMVRGRQAAYGMSLVLSNVPMSPKFINASFAALFDTHDVVVEYARQLHRRNTIDINGPIRLPPSQRRLMKDQGKQYSLDTAAQVIRAAQLCAPVFKQGSLDSKIDEIFDSSVESATASDEQDDSTSGESSGTEKQSAALGQGHKVKFRKAEKGGETDVKVKIKADEKTKDTEVKVGAGKEQVRRRVSSGGRPEAVPEQVSLTDSSPTPAPSPTPGQHKMAPPRICKYCKHVLD